PGITHATSRAHLLSNGAPPSPPPTPQNLPADQEKWDVRSEPGTQLKQLYFCNFQSPKPNKAHERRRRVRRPPTQPPSHWNTLLNLNSNASPGPRSFPERYCCLVG